MKLQKFESAITLNTLNTDSRIPLIKKSQENTRKDPITINDITPELAAQIVRYHILPMFDKKPG